MTDTMTAYEIIADRNGIALPTFLVEADDVNGALAAAEAILGTEGITLELPAKVAVTVE